MTIYESNGKEVALYYGGTPYVLADESTGNIYPTKTMWNGSYLLGTDALGRDILARLMYGTRVSLVVAFVAALVNMVIGILYGGIAGYAGGVVDAVMMRVVDIISTIPLTLYDSRALRWATVSRASSSPWAPSTGWTWPAWCAARCSA